MRKLIIIAFIAITQFSLCQDYNFKPRWNEGDEKQVTIIQTERKYEDDHLISDTIIYNEAQIRVLKDNKDDYLVEILFENQAILVAIEFYNKLGEELKDYKDLRLMYAINKETAEFDLQNWEEVQKFMNDSFDQIFSILEKRVPDIAPSVKMTFLSLMANFKSKESIESYMTDNVEYLFIPYCKNFKVGETITKTDTQENPFNPMQEITATTLLKLESIDKESKTCSISQEVQFDLSEFIEMMKGMIQSMSKSFGVNDSIMSEKSREMDRFEINIENRQIITFDYDSTWITKIVGTGIITGTDPKKE